MKKIYLVKHREDSTVCESFNTLREAEQEAIMFNAFCSYEKYYIEISFQ